MIKLEDNTPLVYTEQSRDFQLFCRLYDCVNNAVRFDIKTMLNVLDPMQVNDRMLPLMCFKVGFFPKQNYPASILRYIIASFPYAVKYKGTKRGIELAVSTILKAEGDFKPFNEEIEASVDIDSKTHLITIYTTVPLTNKQALEDFLSYILPTGYAYELGVYSRAEVNGEWRLGNHRIDTLRSPTVNISQVRGADRYRDDDSNNPFQFKTDMEDENIGTYTNAEIIGSDNYRTDNAVDDDIAQDKRDTIDEHANTKVYHKTEDNPRWINDSPSFATDSWETINYYANNGTAKLVYNVGDEKTIKLSTGEEITLQILDFNHDTLSDGTGKAGITLGTKNLLTSKYMMAHAHYNNRIYWEDCYIRIEMLPLLFDKLPASLRNIIKTVNKETVAEHMDKNQYSMQYPSEITVTQDKLFLFSTKELDSQSIDGGDTYKYWRINNNSDSRIKKLANGSGSVCEWWLRTPDYESTAHLLVSQVQKTGDFVYNTRPNTFAGICFGFCIGSHPSTFATDSWETINNYAEQGLAEVKYDIGDEKTITLKDPTTNEEENVTLQILGFNHDDLADGTGKAGMTIGVKNLLKTEHKMNDTNTNLGNWEACKMHTDTMSMLFNSLPTNLQNMIKTVNKKTTEGQGFTAISVSYNKLFLFGLAEVVPEASELTGYKDEGTIYQYWNEYNTSADRIKKLANGTGIDYWWWLRSPVHSKYFAVIDYDGRDSSTNAWTLAGVCFGFCLGRERPATFSAFATDSWATINNYARQKIAQNKYQVGDEKTIFLENGEPVTLQILDFNYDNLADNTGKANITIGMKNLLETPYPMNDTDTTAGGWGSSLMHTSTMPLLFSKLPADLRAVIKTVKKGTIWMADDSSTVFQSTNDQLFLFNRYEIDNYEYWRRNNTHSATKKRSLYNYKGWANLYDEWWLRSPRDGSNSEFIYVDSNGNPYPSDYGALATQWKGVCFGFCI